MRDVVDRDCTRRDHKHHTTGIPISSVPWLCMYVCRSVGMDASSDTASVSLDKTTTNGLSNLLTLGCLSTTVRVGLGGILLLMLCPKGCGRLGCCISISVLIELLFLTCLLPHPSADLLFSLSLLPFTCPSLHPPIYQLNICLKHQTTNIISQAPVDGQNHRKCKCTALSSSSLAKTIKRRGWNARQAWQLFHALRAGLY